MTDIFLHNIFSIQPNTIIDKTYHQASKCFTDYLACTLAGVKYLEARERTYLKSISSENDSASIIGLNCKSSAVTAALFNGMASHVLELDDGHRGGAIHVGGTIFSALLAVAEKEGISYQDFLYGAIIGYEASIRLACAVQPGNKLRGYHATGTCGTAGATLGIAAALHFTKAQTKTAFSAAITSAAGILEMQENDSELKPYNVGRAAMDAVVAAYIGKSGFKGPNDPLGGKRGFLKVMSDSPNIEILKEFNSKSLCIEQIYQKTYAACRHAHPAIEATMTLGKTYRILPSSVHDILVKVYHLAVMGHNHTEIPSISSAKMSIPFCVALSLFRGDASMSDFNEENVRNTEILKLTQKVKVIEDETLSALVPTKRSSIVQITLNDGSVFSHRVDFPKGEPENPLSDEELEQKFYSLAMNSGLTREHCSQILGLLHQPTIDLKQLLAYCI